MNAYPIGNDLTVKWSLLYSDGSVFPLSNYDYEFSYRTNRGHKIVNDTSVISVEENILTWTFKGDEQVVSGRYTLCLKITLSGSKIIELQYDNAFMLSPLSGFKGAGSEIMIQSYCDAIDLKDAVLQARKAMDLAADAVIDTANIRMFRKIAGIGDSLMSGCIQKTRTDAHDFNNMSWLSFIAYDSGAIATHYSTGGYTAKNWIDGDGGHKAKLASDPKSWAYFIGFGTNDADSSKASYPLGSIEDTAGADSFVGYYKQIVEYVHTQAPNAKIFCMSTYRRTEPYGKMVGEIAKLYDYCYFIDIIKCSDVTLMSDSSYVCFDHFSTQGYIALAKNITKEVNRIISDNMLDFIYVGYDNN